MFVRKGNMWVSSEDLPAVKCSESRGDESLTLTPPTITVLTWNIDFMRPLPKERMSAALAYLGSYISSSVDSSHAVIILFQEMVASDLKLIQTAEWIRERFYTTDRDTNNFKGGYYGTHTLIDRRLTIRDVFRVRYGATRMGRDALFVDVAFPSPQPATVPMGPLPPNTEERRQEKTIRICCTHLESLVSASPLRPLQMATVSSFMQSPTVHGSILAGDLNAIQPFDRTLHTENSLQDAYIELGGLEDSEEGFTWGQMAGKQSREQYGCSRMDKVLFCGKVAVKRLERIGMGVEVDKKEDREMLMKLGDLDGGYATDHLGLRADLEVVK
jgi:tyrosyl-DNA phosphodiesterase 2